MNKSCELAITLLAFLAITTFAVDADQGNHRGVLIYPPLEE
ncbi:MAG: hypothetical protein WAW52_09765 [Methanothrix sp.]